MDELGHPVFDVDNHYYEALDAFTRHLDPALGPAACSGRRSTASSTTCVGGRVSRAVSNATFDPMSKPGCLYDYFRGNADGVNPLARLRDHEPIRPEYRDRDARPAAVLDEQGLAGCWLFPTLGMIYEEPLHHDPEAVCHTFRAFNRWLGRGLGLRLRRPHLHGALPHAGRPSLGGRGARVGARRGRPADRHAPAAPTTAVGRRSPFDPMFDPFWARVNEAGVTVVVHAGDSGVSSNGYAVDGFAATFSGRLRAVAQELRHRAGGARLPAVDDAREPLPQVPQPAGGVGRERRRVPARPVPQAAVGGPQDAGLVRRRPGRGLPPPRLDQPVLGGRPRVVDWMGADRVLFGSDWPHIEALPQPLDYLPEAKVLDAGGAGGAATTTSPSSRRCARWSGPAAGEQAPGRG